MYRASCSFDRAVTLKKKCTQLVHSFYNTMPSVFSGEKLGYSSLLPLSSRVSTERVLKLMDWPRATYDEENDFFGDFSLWKFPQHFSPLFLSRPINVVVAATINDIERQWLTWAWNNYFNIHQSTATFNPRTFWI